MFYILYNMIRVITTTIGLEKELERLRKERDQLNQEGAWKPESERKMGEELKVRDRELAGKTRIVE